MRLTKESLIKVIKEEIEKMLKEEPLESLDDKEEDFSETKPLKEADDSNDEERAGGFTRDQEHSEVPHELMRERKQNKKVAKK